MTIMHRLAEYFGVKRPMVSALGAALVVVGRTAPRGRSGRQLASVNQTMQRGGLGE